MIHSAQGELMPAPASVGPGPVAAAMGRQARAGGPCNARAGTSGQGTARQTRQRPRYAS
jgi:hypothetical protein